MFVILSNVLKLLLAHCAVERTEGFRDFGLDVSLASDVVLPCRKLWESPSKLNDEPLFPHAGPHSL